MTPAKKFDPRLRIALAFVVTAFILILCLLSAQALWEERSTDKFSALDLSLAPIGLAAGLAIGALTGRWRLQALQELAPQLTGLLFREKSVLFRSELGEKALDTENDSYRALFAVVLVAWWATKFLFLPACTAAFFVFGLWLTGQTVPYLRFWLWQQTSGANTISDAASGSAPSSVNLPYEPYRVRPSEKQQTKSQKRFDPRFRIALTLVVLIPCLALAWSLWKEGHTNKSARLDIALIPIGLATGLTVGSTIGRWRLQALRELTSRLPGGIFFRERKFLSRLQSGQNAIRTEKVAYIVAFLICSLPVALGETYFMLVGTFCFFGLGTYFAGQTVPYYRLWREQRESCP